MFGHKHHWHQIKEGLQEDKPHNNFIRTIYFNLEECCECGEQRKQIYNDWVHKPEYDPDPNSQWTPDHSCTMVIGGLGYEKA